ncbi:hypothetical protein [Roseinatronobacter bogoriensis]|uniref:hypothetical protein n=1 Tax=Roseinatronobacter bogoriensis TaxID=119542 RepID=UPI00145629FE|nr:MULTISPECIES: hypothetical protein [Rhodobaca]
MNDICCKKNQRRCEFGLLPAPMGMQAWHPRQLPLSGASSEPGAGCKSRLALPAADPPDNLKKTRHDTDARAFARRGWGQISHDFN